MNYYIEYPIPIRCDLKCPYCFHSEAYELEALGRFEEKYSRECPFTPRRYMAWRDRHLADGNDFLCDLHGGEISHPGNQAVVLEIIDTLDKEKFQLQTNGLGDKRFYEELIERKNKIDRIGFTYHRTAIGNNDTFKARFLDNVQAVQSKIREIYVKELLIPEHKPEIMESKFFWASKGIEYRLQDFKGYRGRVGQAYTPEELGMLHKEYRHLGERCACREGRKQVLMRGYDIFRGDVLACWNDPCVVGNIIEDWYDPDYVVNRVNDMNVVSVAKKIYRGTYPRDIWSPEAEKSFGSLNKKQLNQRNLSMIAWVVNRIEELKSELKKADAMIADHKSEIDRLTATALQIRGAIVGFEELLKNAGADAVNAAGETAAEAVDE